MGLNIRLKGYVYRQHPYTVRQGDGSTTTLPNPGRAVRGSDGICKYLPDFSLYLMLIMRAFVVSVCIN